MSFIGGLVKEMARKNLILSLNDGKLIIKGNKKEAALWWNGAVLIYKDRFVEYLKDPVAFDEIHTHPKMKGIDLPLVTKTTVKKEKKKREEVVQYTEDGCMYWNEESNKFEWSDGTGQNRDVKG